MTTSYSRKKKTSKKTVRKKTVKKQTLTFKERCKKFFSELKSKLKSIKFDRKLKTQIALSLVAVAAFGTAVSEGYKYNKRRLAAIPANDAIIRLIAVNEKEGSCSAFVISDKLALTAGHCINMSIEVKSERIRQLTDQLVSLQLGQIPTNPMQVFALSMKVFKLKSQIHQLQQTPVDQFIVSNSKGQDTGVRVVAVEHANYDSGRDFAILQVSSPVDFSDYKKLDFQTHSFSLRKGDSLKTCGYPWGSQTLICMPLTFTGNKYFSLRAEGFMMQGMSGGPIIDYRGRAVGISSGTSEGGGVYFDSTLGIFGR